MLQFIRSKIFTLLFSALIVLKPCYSKNNYSKDFSNSVEVYTTTADKSKLFESASLSFDAVPVQNPTTITLNPSIKFQEMDGFGAAITGSTCYNLLKMTKGDRMKVLREVFDPKVGMGYSYIRISIGCSDFSMDEYTCCDKKGIANFAIHPLDRRDLLPILKEILAINPQVKIMGSPWTPPRWMKVNNLTDLQPYNSWISGQLNPKYYQEYALYFVKYIQAMQKEGIPIETISIQNEPLNRGNSVSLFMTWQEQRDFIKMALGPQFKAANIKTKILAYDHNYNYDSEKDECKDQIGYPKNIFQDAEASKYIYGSAWHAYGGKVSELDKIHAANPDKGIFFTEMSIGEWGYTFPGDLMWCMEEIGIGTINRNCKAVIVWNLLLDDKNGPDRPGGCNTCYGAMTIHSADYKYVNMDRLSHYYVIGHLSKVVMPGAYRIAATDIKKPGVSYSTFLNPDNSYSIVVENNNPTTEEITIGCNGSFFTHKFQPRSLNSFKWSI